jgi:hypothetical protein
MGGTLSNSNTLCMKCKLESDGSIRAGSHRVKEYKKKGSEF